MDIIIACAGNGTRWNNYMNTEKHLVDIYGEPLLVRTIKQIRDKISCNNIFVSVSEKNKDKFEKYSKDNQFQIIELKSESTEKAPALYTLTEHFNGSNDILLLLGDVYYTDDAINTIAQHTVKRTQPYNTNNQPNTDITTDNTNITTHTTDINNDICFFGRLNLRIVDNQDLIKNYGELFGIFLKKESQLDFLGIANIVSRLYSLKLLKRFIHWEILTYYYTFGLKRVKPTLLMAKKMRFIFKRKDKYFKHNFIEISDETDDFDWPKDYDNWKTLNSLKKGLE